MITCACGSLDVIAVKDDTGEGLCVNCCSCAHGVPMTASCSDCQTHYVTQRLDYLRGEIEAERISYGEIAELQDLSEHIDPGDVVLLQWAGVEEGDGHPFDDPDCTDPDCDLHEDACEECNGTDKHNPGCVYFP